MIEESIMPTLVDLVSLATETHVPRLLHVGEPRAQNVAPSRPMLQGRKPPWETSAVVQQKDPLDGSLGGGGWLDRSVSRR